MPLAEAFCADLRLRCGGCLFILLVAPGIGSAQAQGDGNDEAGTQIPDIDELLVPWVTPTAPLAPDTVQEVDIAARFDAFQRDFDEEFGRTESEAWPGGEEFAARIKERFERRLEGSGILRWYQGAVGLYERAEGLYNRLEGSTKWARKGFKVDANLESVVDGRVNLHVERRIQSFKVGFDVKDATQGKFGLRIGGVYRGYHINVDVGDIAAGQLRLGLKKRWD